MLTAAAVRTAIDLHRLGITVHLFAFRLDMAQLPPVMADVIMLILKDSVGHVVILSDIFPVGTGFPLFMVLQLDEASDPFLFQLQKVFFAAVAAVGSHCLQCVPKCLPVLFQDGDQRVVVGSVIAYISMDNKVILYCDLEVVGRF